MTTVRRVITAQTSDGESVFARDEEVAALAAGINWHPVWGWDEAPTLPFVTPVAEYLPRSVFPQPGGVRVSMIEFPPGIGVNRSADLDMSDMERMGPLYDAGGMHGERDLETGMHATNTIDIAIVISGEIGVEQGDGTEVTLRPGDVLLQMGAVHAWRNRTSAPAVLAFVLIGAERKGSESTSP